MARKHMSLLLVFLLLHCNLTSPAQTAPTLASATPPLYPVAAKAAGHEGQVQLEMVLDTAGNVHNPKVISGPEEFRDAAIQAVLKWHYHAYTDAKGELQPVRVHVLVNFNLGNKKQKAEAMTKAQAELANASSPKPEQQPATPASPSPE